MKKDLFTKAKKSIAFATGAVDDINHKFAEIDKRLFGFAYYAPIPLYDTNAHACFYLAVLNMYGLIWDCGPMLNTLLWNMKNPQGGISSNLQLALQSWEKLASLKTVVEHVRSDICHNNSIQYIFNKKNHDGHEIFLKTHSKNSNLSIFSDSDWEAICDTFLDLCKKFYDDFINSITEIKNLPEILRNEFIMLWLSYIESWYKRNLDISINVLGELYHLSLGQKWKTPRGISRSDIYRWIASNASDTRNISNKDKCLNKIKSILDTQLGVYIRSSECPVPALPKVVLFNIFRQDVLYY